MRVCIVTDEGTDRWVQQMLLSADTEGGALRLSLVLWCEAGPAARSTIYSTAHFKESPAAPWREAHAATTLERV